MIALIDAAEETWNLLKNHLIKTLILAYSDFSKSFILYMNRSKKYDFEIVVHQVRLNSIKHSVLFLSRCLREAEKTYWSTELKVTCLIWVLHKIRHIIKTSE